MSAESTPRPRGRRHNGLAAASYTVVGDVDPRVGEHLLDVLYLYGIAAYLQPSVSFDAALRSVRLPTTPIDQLWVDRQRADEARRLMAAEAAEAGTTVGSSGEPDPDAAQRGGRAEGRTDGPDAGGGDTTGRTPIGVDEEAVWRQLVEAFDAEPSPGPHPWPDAEDLDVPPRGATGTLPAAGSPPGAGPVAPDGPRPPVPRRRAGDLGQLPPSGPPPIFDPHRGEPEPPADDESFVPPPPPPLPRVTKYTAASVLAIVVGALLLFWPGLIGLGDSLSFGLGILAIVTGVAALVWRMRDPEDGEPPDDGAVV